MSRGIGWIKLGVLIGPILFCGCAERQVTFPRYAGGGALTDSMACFYDFDRNGFWYVVFLRGPALLATDHRHAYGTHLLLRPNGDMLFFARCSGRNEVIDLSGQLFKLTEGRVFLTAMEYEKAHSVQLNLPLPRFASGDTRELAHALVDLARQPQIAEFLSPVAQNRLYLDYKAAVEQSIKRNSIVHGDSKLK